MEKKDRIRKENLLSKGLNRINGNILVFLFFLLLSFVFWYLNSLSKEIDTTLRYPVTYSNIPGGNPQESHLPPRLNLMFKGHGYSILRLKLTASQHPVVIDFSEVSYKHDLKSGSDDYYIITAPLITSFNAQLTSDSKITTIKPDTLFFSLE
jgi:hypothetical protein